MLARADASAALERDQQVDALQQAGLLRPVSADLVSRYALLEPGQREAICDARWPGAALPHCSASRS
jgi:hypothetical protein